MKKILLLAPLFLTACPNGNAPLCDLQKSSATKFASAVAANFGCQKVEAIDAAFNKALAPLNLCKTQTSGPISDLLCPPMVKLAVGQGVNLLPKEWECSGGTATETLEVALTNLCKTIPY